MKIFQHRSREERTERVAAMEKFLITFTATTYIKKVWAATVGEALVCPKTLPIDTLWL